MKIEFANSINIRDGVKKYTGQAKYGFHQPGDVRVICKTMPNQVIAQ